MSTPETGMPLYRNGPLIEVVCQLHYSKEIESIDSAINKTLKDSFKTDFFYEKKAPDSTPKTNEVGYGQDVPIYTPYHLFKSKDLRWRLRVSRKLLSLSTTSYDGWDKFSRKMLDISQQFAMAYAPDSYRHLCMRYRNAIRREPLNLAGVPWNELLQAWACGPLAFPEMAEGVDGGVGRWLIKPTIEGYFIEATCALANEQPSGTKAFIIETHTYSNTPTRQSDVHTRFSRIHFFASRFFHSAITERLHTAFGPDDDADV